MAITDNKLLYHIDRLAGNKEPITAEIFLTNYCNNRCSYCRYNHRVGEYMSFEKFTQYVVRLLALGVQGIILTGGGEPTINPDFDRITAWLENNGIPYGINTNFNIMKWIKPNYLKVSLDATNGDEYAYKRGVKKQIYDRVLENIREFAEWRNSNCLKTALGIQIVVSRAEEIKAFYEAHKGLDVDYISFRPIEKINGDYYKADEIEQCIIELNKLKDIDKRIAINYKWGMMGERFAVCHANWSVITLDHKGNVLYCCQKPHEVVGHIMDSDILEKKRNHNTDMSKCEIPCRLSGANKFIRQLQIGCKDSEFI